MERLPVGLSQWKRDKVRCDWDGPSGWPGALVSDEPVEDEGEPEEVVLELTGRGDRM